LAIRLQKISFHVSCRRELRAHFSFCMALMVGCVHGSIVVVKGSSSYAETKEGRAISAAGSTGTQVRRCGLIKIQDIWGPSFKSSWHPKIAALRPLAEEWFSSPHQFPTPVSHRKGRKSLRDKTGIGMYVCGSRIESA
jgi:hypothetical protein